MNLTTIAPTKLRPKARALPVDDRSLVHAPPVDESSVELRRWVVTLAAPFTLGAAFFGLAVGLGEQNWIGPAVVLGPILMMFTFIYLCLTSDTNGTR